MFYLFFLLQVLSVATANDIDIGYNPTLGNGENPELFLTPSANVKVIYVKITAGDQVYNFKKKEQSAGVEILFTWKADPAVTAVNAEIKAVFEDGYVAEAVMPMAFSYGEGLTVDYSSVVANSKAQELRVSVTGFVDSAEVIAFGAEKKILAQTNIDIGAGPGEITVPWIGGVKEVVLLDITLRNESSFAGFTYSPWFLDIPHQDVLFESNSATIDSGEEWKLESTLTELQDVLRKYGTVVPVKLYIAGCTDTVGSTSHNQELSKQRAKEISSWLRNHGYSEPIYYYGFGETLLNVKTGDGIDEAANRRVLYIVTADVPPDLPVVQWKSLP